MPAIRPHKNTLLHLRDSATVDFGPEGTSLINSGVTVVDDVFTFESGDTIETGYNPTDGDTVTISCWYRHAGSNQGIIFSNDTTSSRFVFCFENGNTAAAFSGVTVVQYYFDGITTTTPNRDELYDALVDGDWHHLAVEVTLTSGFSSDTNQLGAYAHSATYNLTGDLADFRINDVSLSAGEIFDLYNGGRGFDLPERRPMTDQPIHLLDGQTDAGGYGEDISLDEVTYDKGAYTFSGTTPHIDFGQTTVLSEADGFSFAGFFKPDAVASRQFLWCHSTVTYIEFNGSTALRYKASDNTLRFVNHTFAADTVYHVALIVKGSTATLYIDGVEEGTFGVNGSSTFSISQISTANATFDYQGDMWDCRVFDREISAEEVANLYRNGLPSVRPSEVLRIDPARYSGSGSLVDESGSGNDTSLEGTTTVTDGTIVFDGHSTDRLEATVSGLTKAQGTYAFWFKPNFDSTDTNAYYFCDVVTTRIAFFKTATALEGIQIYVDGKANTDNGISYSSGEWHHLAATWDEAAAEYKIYFDGESTGTSVASGSLIGNVDTETFRMGRSASGTLPFDGEFDKILISNEVLTADQIAMLAANREFPDHYHTPFGTLGGEETCIQPERNSGALFNDLSPDTTGEGTPSLSDVEIVDGKIEFDGVSDMISLSDLELGSSDSVTLSMWVTRDTGNATMWSARDGGGAYYMGLAAGGGSPASFGYSNMKHYVNGVDLGSSPTRAEFTAALPVEERVHVCLMGDTSTNQGTGFQIGKYNNNTGLTLNGRVEDVRVFKRQLTAEEVAFLYNDGTPGVEVPNTWGSKLAVLPSYSTADDDTVAGEHVLDYSGKNSEGPLELFNTPTWTDDTDYSGRKALVYDGTDYLEDHEPSLPGTISKMSILAWVKVTDTSSRRSIISQYGGEGFRSWRLYFDTNGTIRFNQSTDGTVVDTLISSDVWDETGDWLAIAFTFDEPNDEAKLWVNGVLEDTFTGLAGELYDSGLNTRIGRVGAYFIGRHDDIVVYNRVVRDTEILQFSERRNAFGDAYVAPDPVGGGLPPIILF